MANPNNSIGTNAAFSGRTSPNAFNDVLSAFSGRGIIDGWVVSPGTGMKVSLGGSGSIRDVAIAQDNIGNKTTINNIPEIPISLDIASAPATNSRIDAIVIYVDNPPQGSSTETDNYGAVGILDVQGTPASTPVAPNESAIRTAITADGASGTTAYYVVVGYVTIASGTTDITSNMVTQGDKVTLIDGLVTAGGIKNLGGAYSFKASSGGVIAIGADFTSVTVTQDGDYKISANLWVQPGAVSNIYSAMTITKNSSATVLAQVQTKITENYDQRVLHIDYVGSFNAGDVIHLKCAQTAMEASDICLTASRWLG